MTQSPGQGSVGCACYPKGLHRVAVGLALAVFPLVFVGAGVTSKGAGMAFADWPTSARHWLNPPHWLEKNDQLWEHGHRLIGWLVGMLAIGVAVLSWRWGYAMRMIGLAVLAAIMVQGVLGGLRVREVSALLAMVHGVFGQLCFCLVCIAALVSSRSWGEQRSSSVVRAARFLRRLCLFTAVAVFLQLVSGAALRHFASNAATVIHVLGAVVVAMMGGWTAMWVIGQHSRAALLGRFGRVLAGLMVLQLLLGGFSFVVVILKVPTTPLIAWLVPSMHVLTGALLLACSVLLAVSAYHTLCPVEESERLLAVVHAS